jgi:hypothetical protein
MPSLVPVKRPVKVGDRFRFEIGDLLPRRTVQRLQPEVIGVLLTERVNHSFAVMGEAHSPQRWDWALQFHKFGVLRKIDREQS